MSPSPKMRYEWNKLPWKKIQVKVFKLQRRIYRASQQGNVKLVHKLQRLLLKSWYARLLAVRKVSQLNRGKKTAGIDGIKSLTPVQRLKLAENLKRLPEPRPLRRIWIPKPGKPEKRPLSIPVMADRAAQTVMKMALEPQWEAVFEPNVYGYRPGRSCQDAIGAIFNIVRRHPKYLLEGDISGCFENISHSALLRKIHAPPSMSRQLKKWLTCGVLEGIIHPTERGAPQGGPLSPLLALIALHGLETYLKSLGTYKEAVHAVFYADDFVVFSNSEATIHRVQAAIAQWLQGVGLTLHPLKTKISHTLDGQAGFEFLGFSIRQYRVGKYASKQGFKTLIKPSPSSQKEHLKRLKTIIKSHRGATQSALISHLNPVIRGWCQYYSTVVSKEVFTNVHHQLFGYLLRWAKRRHPLDNGHRIVSRYWLVNSGGGWVFDSREQPLYRHYETPIHRHIKVKGSRSPYDGDWTYWGTRLISYPELSPLKSFLLKRQHGKCSHCGLHFRLEEQIELHHLDENHLNQKRDNLTMVHAGCHDELHAHKHKA